jgi:hypothetical protein
LIGLILGGLLLLPGATQGAMDTWIGLGANDNWITLGNWSDGSPPLATDFVTFNASDSGSTNIVNTDFTLVGLRYMGNGTHTTDFAGSSNLQIDGPVYVGYGGSTDGATVTWTNGGSLTIGDSANLRQFYIGFNNTASATNVSSLTINGPHMDAFLSTLAIAPNYSTGATDSELVLGSSGQLHVGTSSFLANVRIGYNDGQSGTSTGLLDAAQGDADLYLFEMNVGYNKGPAGSATGTLRWDQPDPIYAEYVYFGRGTNATGILDVPAGGTFLLGTEADPAGNLIAAYNNSTGPASANLDLTVTDPTFEVHLDDTLAVGLNGSTGTADGQLVLGDNSMVYVGTPSAVGKSTLGYNNGFDGTGTGLLDASQGTLAMHLSSLLVGDNKSGDAAAAGTAVGTLTTGENTTITASTVHIGRGPGATGTVNMNGGLFAADAVHLGADGTFNFNDGRVAVNTFITYGGAGALEQRGGTLAPGFSRTDTSLAGLSIISGDYLLDTAGVLEIELFGTDPGVSYDQLRVYGLVDLDADSLGGGALDVKLNFAPEIGDEFVIIDNDGRDAIFGRFRDLPELAQFQEAYLGTLYMFEISYCYGLGDVGNDVVLRMIGQAAIPAPGALVLAGLGVGLTGWLRRRRTV